MDARLRAVAVGALLTGAVVVTAGYGAESEAATFRDRAGEHAGAADILRVRVLNEPHSTRPIVVRVRFDTVRAGDGLLVWLDTDPERRGPEHRAGGIANSDALGVSRVAGWSGTAQPVRCPSFRMIYDQWRSPAEAVLRVPRSCVGRPDAIRVNVVSRRQGHDGAVLRDFAPAWHAFYAWVPR